MTEGLAVELLTRGEEALASGDWEGARAAFEAAVREVGSPESHDGLGRAAWWLGDVDTAIVNRERAYAAFRKRGDAARPRGSLCGSRVSTSKPSETSRRATGGSPEPRDCFAPPTPLPSTGG